MSTGLKAHTRRERAQIVEALAPLIQTHAGSNLIALAVSGSFARGSDGDYSDIEIFGFVKRSLPDDRAAVRFIHDGLLVDAWFLTRDDYIHIFKDKVRLGNHPWPYIALNALVPVTNAAFIENLNALPSTTRPEEFKSALLKYWPQVQEATGKFLTAVSQGNDLSLPSLYWQMVEKMCFALSLLNERPFTTASSVFREALTLPVLPVNFSSLMLDHAAPRIPSELAKKAITVFGELEDLLSDRGYKLYADSLDAFVSPYSRPREFVRRIKIDRVAHKMMLIFKAFGLG